MKEKNADRRNFLKNTALLGLGAPAVLNMGNTAFPENDFLSKNLKANNSTLLQAENEFSIFITTDLHAQIHTHDEFFWEKDKAVYKKEEDLQY